MDLDNLFENYGSMLGYRSVLDTLPVHLLLIYVWHINNIINVVPLTAGCTYDGVHVDNRSGFTDPQDRCRTCECQVSLYLTKM